MVTLHLLPPRITCLHAHCTACATVTPARRTPLRTPAWFWFCYYLITTCTCLPARTVPQQPFVRCLRSLHCAHATSPYNIARHTCMLPNTPPGVPPHRSTPLPVLRTYPTTLNIPACTLPVYRFVAWLLTIAFTALRYLRAFATFTINMPFYHYIYYFALNLYHCVLLRFCYYAFRTFLRIYAHVTAAYTVPATMPAACRRILGATYLCAVFHLHATTMGALHCCSSACQEGYHLPFVPLPLLRFYTHLQPTYHHCICMHVVLPHLGLPAILPLFVFCLWFFFCSSTFCTYCHCIWGCLYCFAFLSTTIGGLLSYWFVSLPTAYRCSHTPFFYPQIHRHKQALTIPYYHLYHSGLLHVPPLLLELERHTTYTILSTDFYHFSAIYCSEFYRDFSSWGTVLVAFSSSITSSTGHQCSSCHSHLISRYCSLWHRAAEKKRCCRRTCCWRHA